MDVLQDVLLRFHQLDVTLKNKLRLNSRLGGRDRRFITTHAYTIIRQWQGLLHQFNLSWPFDISKEEFEMVISQYFINQGHSFQDWWPYKVEKATHHFDQSTLAPSWFESKLNQTWSNRSKAIFKSLWQEAPVFLRLTVEVKKATDKLKKVDIEGQVVEGLERAITIERDKIKKALEVLGAWAQVQDGASQQIAPLLIDEDLKQGVILDACAGAGGKTLHLAALLKNKSGSFRLMAYEPQAYKLAQLQKRFESAHQKVELLKLHELNNWQGKVDRLLLDVPCSGLGSLRRHPDLLWQLNEDKIQELAAKQKEILEFYAPLVKKEGMMVYATCSILPEENQQQVSDFLARHDNWTLKKEVSFIPDQNNFDGLYGALLQRIN